MLYKARTEPLDLLILKILNVRMDLTVDEQKYYSKLKKGFEGEVLFDLLIEKLQNECFMLNDLLLEVNNTKFQIDSSIIYQETIYLFEIKNYEGDYCYESDGFHWISGKEITDPLDQLKRSNILLRQLLQKLGYNLPIEAYVVFINLEFTLYQAPKNLPIIFPTQLNRFLKKLNMKPSRLNNRHKKLADQLVSLHINESPYTKLPTYEYDQIKKGITCKKCSSFSMSVRGKIIVCGTYGCEEEVESAVMRSVVEIKLLFPDWKITTNVVHEWCMVVESKKTIRRILTQNFKVMGHGKFSYFVSD